MTSLYERLENSDQLLKVDMNDVEILDPRRCGDKIAIGTKDLNGCSTIVIIDKGVILAHIAPMGPADGQSQASTGMEHFMVQAKAAVTLMKKNKELFDKSTTTWGIFARVGADIPLDHYANWLRQLFEHMKIPMQQAYYDVDPESKAERKLPTGSVVVLQQGREPRLFLEDREQVPRVQRIQAGVSRPLPTASAAAGPSTQNTMSTDRMSARQPSKIGMHPGVYSSKAPESASTNSGSNWVFRGSTFCLIQNGVALKQQLIAPEKQPFLNESLGLWMMKDGANRWVHKNGAWTKA